jgi:protein SCO1/2
MRSIFKLIVVTIFCLNTIFIMAEDKKIEIGVDEQLGAKLPLNLSFNDEQGNKVILKDLFTRPTVLAFVYYECPGICTPLMTSVAEVVNKVDLKPGEQYNIVTVSMDELETPKLAAKKKVNYMKIIETEFPEQSWKFLTGDSISIKTLADAAGFYFKREGDQFIHSGALIFVSSEGKICRYLFPQYTDKDGYSILPFDFKMAIVETSKGIESPTVARFLQFCFSYDPEGKTYTLNITRIFGAGIVLFAVIFVLYLKVKPKKEKSEV